MSRQGGFSLIEVLVAAVIMALGLSGLAALLLRGIADTSNAQYTTTAALLAGGLAAQVRLVPDAADRFLVPAPEFAPDCGPPQPCTPAQFAAQALHDWQADLKDRLPGSSASVCRDSTPDDGAPESHSCDGAGPLVIKMYWRNRLAGEAGSHLYFIELSI